MLVKTLKRHRYNAQLRCPGDEYELPSAKHVKLLEAVGRVRRVPVAVAPLLKEEKVTEKKSTKKESTKKESTKKESPKKESPKKESPKKKSGGTYKRKDMVAE